jgi:hypothetical protein
MRRWFASEGYPTMRLLLLAVIFAGLVLPGRAQSSDWKRKLGDDPIFASTLDRYLASAASLIKQLPDATQAPTRDTWQPVSDTCSALVNVYRLSLDKIYLDQARQIADWLIHSNDFLVAHRDPSIPYLGWGPETRDGYFKCSTVSDYHADDLWDTASVARCLLKVAEVDPAGTSSEYFQRVKDIIDAWPYISQTSPDDPYAAAGLRWYRKSNEPCENRYVKNTNVAMGEQLFRIYRLTHDAQDFDRAVKTLHTQIWDVLVRHNLAYTSYMTYLDHSDDYPAQVAHNERKVVHSDDAIGCGVKDSSCWSHLGYEGYAMFNVQQMTRDIPAAQFPVASTKDDIAKTIQVTMDAWHKSQFGDAERFDWEGKESTTHVTAYNCALRFSADPAFDRECRLALQHRKPSATVFYALVPESLF